jgi:hypothetical protein
VAGYTLILEKLGEEIEGLESEVIEKAAAIVFQEMLKAKGKPREKGKERSRETSEYISPKDNLDRLRANLGIEENLQPDRELAEVS